MKKSLAILLTLVVASALAAGTATAGKGKGKGVFAGATHVELVLTLRDGSTKTLSLDARPEKGSHPFRGVVHAEITITLKDGSTRQLQYDRGAIQTIGSDSIAIVRRDKQTVTLAYDGSTRVREAGKTEAVADLAVGERAMFFSQNGKAVLIRCVSAGKQEQS